MSIAMRNLIVLVTTLLLAATAAAAQPEPGVTPPAAVTLGAPVFVLTGGGYGHGVGLNQYGAFAQAGAGKTYRDVLAFYYPGTQIERTPVTTVRVLVASGRRSLRISSPVPFRVRDTGSSATYRLPAGEIALQPELALELEGVRTPVQGPLVVLPGRGATLALDGTSYRGELHVTLVGGALQVVDRVGLDAYLQGVVPGEMPREWPAEALKAQAVAARSYTLASLVKGKLFDLYADARSQAYYGVRSESPSTTEAVQATGGEVITFAGKVATAFYYSSSGGRTASAEDVFGVPLPYLQARDDPWDDLSPYHRWEPRALTAAALAQAFGLASPVMDVASVPTPSGRPASVTLITRAGGAVQLRAVDVRTRLGLRSTAFRLGVLRLGRITAPVPAGTAVTLNGVARDVDTPVLERRLAGGAWKPTARVPVRTDGSFALTLRPQATSTYRLSAAGLSGPATTVTVGASG